MPGGAHELPGMATLDEMEVSEGASGTPRKALHSLRVPSLGFSSPRTGRAPACVTGKRLEDNRSCRVCPGTRRVRVCTEPNK